LPPTFLRGKPGQKLTLLVESEARTLHNLSISSLGIDKDIPPKGKVRLDVTFPASGVLAFTCKFHGGLGMNGQLLTGYGRPLGTRGSGESSFQAPSTIGSPMSCDRGLAGWCSK
jgi:hypothetical protein